jgi:ubiquinone/menaquinone biosynthesis C-methylase UbiE
LSIPFTQISFPEMYERLLVGPLFRPFAEALLDTLELRAGERVLDVACGTGIAARLAKERVGDEGRVVGVDMNAGMLSVARSAAPEIDWREGNATALPIDAAERFDVVVCHQGFQFFPDRAAAAREMRRAIAAGGRLGIGTWRGDEEVPLGEELRRVAERHVGPIADRRHSLGDPSPVEAALRDAGFREVHSTIVVRTVRFADGLVFVRLNAMALVGMSASAGEMAEAERQRLVDVIVADSADVLARYSDAQGLRYELATNVTTAS